MTTFDDAALLSAWRSHEDLVEVLSRAVRALNRVIDDAEVGRAARATREQAWALGGSLVKLEGAFGVLKHAWRRVPEAPGARQELVSLNEELDQARAHLERRLEQLGARGSDAPGTVALLEAALVELQRPLQQALRRAHAILVELLPRLESEPSDDPDWEGVVESALELAPALSARIKPDGS